MDRQQTTTPTTHPTTSPADPGHGLCLARAHEARTMAQALCGARERAIWSDVAGCWSVAASVPNLRRRAAQLQRAAEEWSN